MKKLVLAFGLVLPIILAASVTYQTTDVQHIVTATFVDSANNPISPIPAGYTFNWTTDENGVLVSLQPNTNAVTIHIKGIAGTFNLTCTAIKSGSPTATGTMQVNIQGPVVDHLVLSPTS